MKKVLGILIIVLVLVFSGCGKKSDLVGDWNYYDGKESRNDIRYSFNKNKTGKYVFFGDIKDFTYEFDDKYITIKLNDNKDVISKFEYNINNGILTLKDTNVNSNNSMYKKG